MATIYLSSTYEDLKDYRSAVYDALHKAGHQVIAMEDYVAADERPVAKCLKDVEKADLYVGLFAFRYGYVPPPKHKNPKRLSITELEYRQAKVLGRPRLVFLAKEDAGISLKHVDDYTKQGDQGKCINALRQHLLTEKTASQFSAPHELSTLVLAAVAKYLAEHEQPKPVKKLGASHAAAITWNIKKEGSPYPGLMHFTGMYAKVFFGRDREVREILDRLREPENRFLLISGASGNGKSSLVDAGVLPRIEKDGIFGDKTYTCVRMVPSRGDHPFDALLPPLHAYAERAGLDAYDLPKQLVAQPKSLSKRIQTILAKGLNTDGLVLFIDQMEELFTLRDQAQSHAFLSALYQAVQDANFYVIATIRSDFLQYCHEHDDLRSILNGQGHYALGSIDGMSLREMITKPASCAGLKISETLVQRLVEEAGQERGSLPLLAFALRQLFDKRAGQELTERAFNQLGGVVGAIRSHVTTVEKKIGKLVGIDDKDVFAALFGSLVVVSIDRTPTRQWASKETFDAKVRSVIDVLIQERLLTAAEGKKRESLISVAHEKLFQGWPRLAAWIEANREDHFILHQAEIEAGEWERHRYDLNYLWPEERLKKLKGILEGVSNRQVTNVVRQYAAPQDKLITRLQDVALSHNERLKIGQYLAALGDPRPGVGLKQDGLPDIKWIEVPGGQVKLEGVKHRFKVKRFRIAKYPVTNAEFDAFFKAEDGYRNKKWWKDIEQSKEAKNPPWSEVNCPRETVSWCEAIAFCRWLSAKTGASIRLPTEWEWQQAATGGDPRREYPWEGGWDGSRCNSGDNRLNRTTAVGIYPIGATTQGVYDMAGNVWEWCLNRDENPEHLEAMRIDKEGGGRVIRGGSWYNSPGALRASYRDRNNPGHRYSNIGFRLAQDTP